MVVPLQQVAVVTSADVAALGVGALLGANAWWGALIQVIASQCVVGQRLALWADALGTLQNTGNKHKDNC